MEVSIIETRHSFTSAFARIPTWFLYFLGTVGPEAEPGARLALHMFGVLCLARDSLSKSDFITFPWLGSMYGEDGNDLRS